VNNDAYVTDELCANPEWQAAVARQELLDSHRPAVTPECPPWCKYAPGHEYDSVDLDDVTFIRDHVTHPHGSPTSIAQEERNRDGVVTLLPPVIAIYGEDDSEDIDAAGGGDGPPPFDFHLNGTWPHWW